MTNAWEGRVEQLIGRRGLFTFRPLTFWNCLDLYTHFSYLLSGPFYEWGFLFQFMLGGGFKLTPANTRDVSPIQPDIGRTFSSRFIRYDGGILCPRSNFITFQNMYFPMPLCTATWSYRSTEEIRLFSLTHCFHTICVHFFTFFCGTTSPCGMQ